MKKRKLIQLELPLEYPGTDEKAAVAHPYGLEPAAQSATVKKK